MQGRRRFLEMFTAAAGSAVLTRTVAGCGDDVKTGSPPPKTVAAGKTADVPVGAIREVPGQPVVVARDTRGLYAMSTVCTHERCDMRSSGKISDDGLVCTCHDSTFDKNGVPMTGPAGRQLDHYKVEIAADGAITITTSQTVGADERVAVPG